MDTYFDKMHGAYQKQTNGLKSQLSKIEKEFDQFRKDNNLSEFFTMNCNQETRKRVLKDVEELQKPVDWHYFDPSVIHRLHPSDPSQIL